MSYIDDICAVLENNRWRGLTGSERGIVKAIAARDDASAEDYEWLTVIIGNALRAEIDAREEARTADDRYDARVVDIATNYSRAEIEQHIAQVENNAPRLHAAAERGRNRMATGRRSSSAAVAAEAHAQTWEALRPWRAALAHVSEGKA